MSASYSCGKCGATSGSPGTCCGQPMGTHADVNQAAVTRLRTAEVLRAAAAGDRKARRS